MGADRTEGHTHIPGDVWSCAFGLEHAQDFSFAFGERVEQWLVRKPLVNALWKAGFQHREEFGCVGGIELVCLCLSEKWKHHRAFVDEQTNVSFSFGNGEGLFDVCEGAGLILLAVEIESLEDVKFGHGTLATAALGCF
jgi:hypothetical protein